MRRLVLVCAVALIHSGPAEWTTFPLAPPAQIDLTHSIDRTITLEIHVDDDFVRQHAGRAEEFIREAVTIHNIEWRRYRREWFHVTALQQRPSEPERDGSYVLAKFHHSTKEARDTIHVLLTGLPLEVYTNGRDAVAVAGLAYRGSDTIVISATSGVPADLLGYYLFHELGHSWDARDLPFRGGDSTFGSRSGPTFRIDAGNEEIIEESAGPQPRSAPYRAPFVIREKLGSAQSAVADPEIRTRLSDALLHEPSPANPAYVKKRDEVLAGAGPHRDAAAAVFRRYEITPDGVRDDIRDMEQIASHYWRANDAIARDDLAAAEIELEAIRVLDHSASGVHHLVSAVGKKIRKRGAR